MARSILSRYLDPHVLSRMADRPIEPRGLVMGSLAGAHKSPSSGFAVEFAGHREYFPGDDPKHIDWRLYFTRDKYFIKQYEMETNFVCHLILDVSTSMLYGGEEKLGTRSAERGAGNADPNGSQLRAPRSEFDAPPRTRQKLMYAAQMATALGYSIIRQNDKVSFGTFDEFVLGFIPPSNSMSQILRMTEHLDELEPAEKTRMPECLTELASKMHRREIVMIFSDFFTDLDALEPALQRMRYNQHEVVLFHVLHHDELHFDFDGMVKFIGLEDPADYTTQTEDIRRAYLRAVAAFNRRFEELCQRNRIERVEVDTSRDMAEVLIDYLNHRSRLNRGR